jgi:hypothetical protein
MMMLALSVSRIFKILMIASVMSIGTMWFDAAHSDVRTQEIVTVYSDGKVVAVYEAVDRGRMENNCYVFHIRKGVQDVEVRVCGTFTVEQVK